MPEDQVPAEFNVFSRPEEVVYRTSGEAPTYYVNSVNVAVGPFDFILTLNQVAEVSSERVVYERVARIIFSPQHAKVLAEVLAGRVAQFEGTFGELPSREAMDTMPAAAIERVTGSEGAEAATESDAPSEPEQPA